MEAEIELLQRNLLYREISLKQDTKSWGDPFGEKKMKRFHIV